ncbi:MAG: DNA gyrase C-terminal beta-propeller domain-containing protein, partial [Nitriliruptoraceae bacterium]
HRVSVADVPVVRANQRGTHVGGLLGGGLTGPLAGAVALGDDTEGMTVVLATERGMIKRTSVEEFDARQRTIQAAKLRDGDAIAAVALCRDEDDLLLAHDAGSVARFAASTVRTMGRSAAGVSGMQVPDKARIVALSPVPAGSDDGWALTIAADGVVKKAPLADYPTKGRGGKGVTAGTEAALRWCGVAGDVHVAADSPMIVRAVDVAETRRSGRGTRLIDPVDAPVVPEQQPRD